MSTSTCGTIGCLKALNNLRIYFCHSLLEVRAQVIPENHTSNKFRVRFRYCCILLNLNTCKMQGTWILCILWEQKISEFVDTLCCIGHYVIVTWIKQWSVALIKMCYCIVHFVLQYSVSEAVITETVQRLSLLPAISSSKSPYFAKSC